MNISIFRMANKLITGNGATEKLMDEVVRLHIKNPLIVTDKVLESVGVIIK